MALSSSDLSSQPTSVSMGSMKASEMMAAWC